MDIGSFVSGIGKDSPNSVRDCPPGEECALVEAFGDPNAMDPEYDTTLLVEEYLASMPKLF